MLCYGNEKGEVVIKVIKILDEIFSLIYTKGRGQLKQKRFLSGIARIMVGGATHARIFWPSF